MTTSKSAITGLVVPNAKVEKEIHVSGRARLLARCESCGRGILQGWGAWSPVLLICAGLVSGCTLVRIYATSGNEVALTQVSSGGGEQFKINHRQVFDYTGSVDVQELLRDHYGSGHVFQNVTIKYKNDVVDILLNLVTLGLASSRSFEVSGDMVR